jgi:hypothetical protein
MDSNTNTRQIVNLNNQHIGELEKALALADTQFKRDCTENEALVELNRQEYISRLNDALQSAYRDLSKSQGKERVDKLRDEICGLIDARAKAEAELRSQPLAAADKYVKSLDAAFEIAFCQIASLFEKRSKDYFARIGQPEDGRPVNSAELQKAHKFMQNNAKAYRKALHAKERDEVQEFLKQKFEEYKGLVARAERQKQEFDSIDCNPFRLPVRVHYARDGQVEITLPVLRESLERSNGLLKLVSNRIGELAPSGKRDSTLVSYRDRFTENHLPERIDGVLKSIEHVAKARIEPYVIETREPEQSKVVVYGVKSQAVGQIVQGNDAYALSVRNLAERFGVSYGQMVGIVHKSHKELLGYSRLVPEKKRRNKVLRLFSEQVFSELEKIVGKNEEKAAPCSNREALLKKGDDFLNKYLERPTAKKWEAEYGGEALSEIIAEFRSFEYYADALCGKAKNGGVRKPTRRYQSALVLRDAEKDLRDIDVAGKHGIAASTVSRIRERAGIWNKRYFRANYPAIDDIAQKHMPGVISYPKDKIREEIILKAIDHLKTENINYLGLEGAHFGSYIWLNDFYKIDPKKSLVAECNTLDYRIMRSIIECWEVLKSGKKHKSDGRIFRDLNLYHGNLQNAVAEFAKKREKPNWNLLYLDYNGCVNDEKIGAWECLFKNKLIAKEAVMFITLNNSEYMQERVFTGNGLNGGRQTKGFGTRDQVAITGASLLNFAKKYGYDILPIDQAMQYKSKELPMLFLGYKITRRDGK